MGLRKRNWLFGTRYSILKMRRKKQFDDKGKPGVILGRKTIPTFSQNELRGSRDPDRSVGAGSLNKDSQVPNQMLRKITYEMAYSV